MNYQIGDTVIITAPLGNYCANSGLAHIDQMDKFTGEVAVINNIDCVGDLLLSVGGTDTGWYWSDEWIVPFDYYQQIDDVEFEISSLL